MRLDRGRWKALAAACAERARGAVWAAALGVLAVVLAALAWRAREEGRGLARRDAELDRQIERLRTENQSMRDELRALESDPVYVESLLRQWKMASAGERLVE